MKLLALISNKPSYYYDQPSAGLIKWPLLNLPKKYSHAPQCTKYISSMTFKVSTLLHIQNN